MKTRKNKEVKGDPGFKGELVPEKDPLDLEPTGRYMKNNPYKTPPNNIFTKGK